MIVSVTSDLTERSLDMLVRVARRPKVWKMGAGVSLIEEDRCGDLTASVRFSTHI